MRPVLLQESPCCAANSTQTTRLTCHGGSLSNSDGSWLNLLCDLTTEPAKRGRWSFVSARRREPGSAAAGVHARSPRNARRASIKMLQAIARRDRRHGNSGSAVTPARRASGHGRPARSFVPHTSGSLYGQQRLHIASRALVGPPIHRAEANQRRRQPICALRLGPTSLARCLARAWLLLQQMGLPARSDNPRRRVTHC